MNYSYPSKKKQQNLPPSFVKISYRTFPKITQSIQGGEFLLQHLVKNYFTVRFSFREKLFNSREIKQQYRKMKVQIKK